MLFEQFFQWSSHWADMLWTSCCKNWVDFCMQQVFQSISIRVQYCSDVNKHYGLGHYVKAGGANHWVKNGLVFYKIFRVELSLPFFCRFLVGWVDIFQVHWDQSVDVKIELSTLLVCSSADGLPLATIFSSLFCLPLFQNSNLCRGFLVTFKIIILFQK